mgnify:CR=1 FL=1
MSEQGIAGVYQLDNGYWGYRYSVTINGKRKENKKIRNEEGKPFKTQKQAAKARMIAIQKEKENMLRPQIEIVKKTVEEVFQEYCECGRSGKAYTTIVKQDSLWKNHLKERFGKRYIDEISVAEIQDYLEGERNSMKSKQKNKCRKNNRLKNFLREKKNKRKTSQNCTSTT